MPPIARPEMAYLQAKDGVSLLWEIASTRQEVV
jgi:hypothetical protein